MLIGIRRLARILRWLVVASDRSTPLRSFAATASLLPETSTPGAAAATTRQPPRTPIVPRFNKGTEAIVRRMDVCYRHPGRETAVSCSNCGRPICPDCMTSTSVGMRCPECAKQKVKVRGIGSTRDEPVLTYILIGICVAVFVGEVAGGASATGSGFGGGRLVEVCALSG